MNTTLQHIARDLVVLNRNLLKLVATERPRTKQTAVKRVATTHKRRARRTLPTVPRFRTTQPRAIPVKAKGRAPLSEGDKRAIRTLLEAGTIPVSVISKLYGRSPAYIYHLNKSLFGGKSHKASPALMAGIKRLKAQRAKEAREQEAARSAPTKLVDQPEVTPTQTPTQAAPQAIPEPVPMAARPVEV